MKVSELIEKLNKFDQNAEVCIKEFDWDDLSKAVFYSLNAVTKTNRKYVNSEEEEIVGDIVYFE